MKLLPSLLASALLLPLAATSADQTIGRVLFGGSSTDSTSALYNEALSP